jgi:basic membrane protein A
VAPRLSAGAGVAKACGDDPIGVSQGVMSRGLLVVLLVIGVAGSVVAEPRTKPRDLKVAVLLDPHGRGDRAFNDSALAGVDAAKKHGRIALTTRLAPRPLDAPTLVDLVAAESPDLIVGVGPLYVDTFRQAARRHPRARFLLLDAAVLQVAHVRSATFRSDEGSFLAGVVAAVESKRGRVGFVGAVETPEALAFECGWETGVRWATKERYLSINGRASYIGTTNEAFADPHTAEEVTLEMIAQQGADVVYATAGPSGLGVMAAARHANAKVIGFETDQSHVAHDVVITSVRKRLDRAVEAAIADVRRGLFDGGVRVMNLANGGIDLVLPGRLSPATVKLVEKARGAVVTGATPACVKPEDRVHPRQFVPRPPGYIPPPLSLQD